MSKSFNVEDVMFISTREMIIKLPEIKRETMLADRFVVSHKLNEGSIGTLYVARDNVTGLDVALKIVNGNCAASVVRLLHEKRIYDSINDTSFVVKCFGLHQSEVGHIPVMFIVKEYASGGTLMDWLITYTDDHGHRLNFGLENFIACARAAASLHRQGITVNDLSLSNFVKVDGVWKICDLDLASCKTKNILCKVGPPLWGTPAIMSPEAFDVNCFAELNFSSDIYSMGIILHWMLSATALAPFCAESYERIRQLQYSKRPPVLDGVDEYLVQIVDKALKKYPDERYGNTEQMIDDIDNKKPEVIADDLGDEHYMTGKAKYDNGQYRDAEIYLSKVISGHNDFGHAAKILEDIRIRYGQVGQMASKISDRLINSRSIAGSKDLCDQCNLIYPGHPLLRPIEAELKVNANNIDHLFGSFNASLKYGDLKGIEHILLDMEAADYHAEKTCTARRIVNGIESNLDEMEDQLDIAERCHDYDHSLKVNAEYGKKITSGAKMLQDEKE